MKMFQKIQELVDDKDSLVCILIDEVSVMTKFCSVPTIIIPHFRQMFYLSGYHSVLAHTNSVT